ncbi:hypothetical protein ASPCAL13997 [Aspergillus calidoustus]|uniref:Carrier domain-containing protein n=1 Tax=Aspergillus calidoustus TaxID=454130 RepID=A0A0U5CJ10_ASPCI|nr:hypothetical protein ASPCAL13997 [Aspergillus calidoustus]
MDEGNKPCPTVFPRLNKTTGNLQDLDTPTRQEVSAQVQLPTRIQLSDKQRIVTACWATLLGRYTESRSVIFGIAQSGSAEKDHIPSTMIRVEHWLLRGRAGSKLLDAERRELGQKWLDAPLEFNTAIVFPREWNNQHVSDSKEGVLLSTTDVAVIHPTATGPALPECLILRFNPSFICRPYSQAIINTLASMVGQVARYPDTRVDDVALLGSGYIQTVAEWNGIGALSEPHEQIHTLISRQCVSRSESEAMVGPGGSITYAELDRRAEAVRRWLHRQGVGRGDALPICFEKSIWVGIAMLGVLRTGAAFVLMDPSHPFARLQDMCSDIEPKVIITSRLQAPIAQRLGASRCLVLPDDLDHKSNPVLPAPADAYNATPQDAAYIAYTSGSTGRPKGIIVEHGAFCANAILSSRFQDLNVHSRVLQFASYAFDISIQEVLTTLIVGGCVCIPTEEQRLGDLAEVIGQLRVNWVELTPSVSRLLRRDALNIRTLVLGGEPMTPLDIEYWSDHVHLVNAYGPAECSVVTTIQPAVDASDPANIGRSYSGTCWVVDPDNYHQLAPIGAVGELLVGGPIVGRGYLNRPTERRFIESPRWAAAFNIHKQNHFYRTGDLVQYAPDGSLRYIGRRDTEVKISGQRIDLQEIEIQAAAMQLGLAVAADVVCVDGDGEANSISLFLTEAITNAPQTLSPAKLDPGNVGLQRAGSEVRLWLQKTLPPYMLPCFYIPLTHLPLSATGKVDRRRLKELGKAYIELTKDQATTCSELCSRRLNCVESALQELFGELLGRPMDTIKPDDNFFHLGGSSVKAIKLASRARDIGLPVTAGDVLTLQTIAALGHLASTTSSLPSTWTITPSSSSSNSSRAEGMDLVHLHSDIPPTDIEEILPCTPTQEALVALSLQPGISMTGRFMFKISPSVPIARFQTSWEEVVAANQILRTRIAQDHDGKLRQIVLKQKKTNWTMEVELSKVDERFNRDHRAILGKPLAQFAIVGEQPSAVFILDMHHAIFDGWSFLQIIEDQGTSYAGRKLPPAPPYRVFIEHIMDIDAADTCRFWTSEFAHLKASPYPATPDGWRAEGEFSRTTRRINLPAHGRRNNHRLPSAIKLAWSLVVSAQTSCNEVVIGVVESGRHAPVPAIDRITGPTIATVPLRVNLQPDMSVDGMLRALSGKSIEAVPYQHTGLQRIRTFSSEAALACDFQNLLVIQPQSMSIESEIMTSVPGNHEEIRHFCSHVLTIVVELERDDSINLTAFFDSAILLPDKVDSLLNGLESVLEILLEQPDLKIGHIQLCTKAERSEMERWNSAACFTGDLLCASDLIVENARTRPNAEAVRAWDGTLTYGQLLTQACALADYLQLQGVGLETITPICTERSKFQAVSALAVMMAGGAFALLEPSFPVERLRYICDQIKAPLILTTEKQRELCGSLVQRVIDLSKEDATRMTPGEINLYHKRNLASASDAMYVAFTSGSTGVPKGVTIEHGMFYASLQGYKKDMGLSASSRVLFFASPAFDISVMELLYPLVAGGCVCIPSETQRLVDLAGAINQLEVNFVILTPSVIRLLRPAEIPHVRTVLLLGESMSASDVATWANAVRLICGYGPAECTLLSTITERIQPGANPFDIGRPAAGTCWVVNPENHHQLVPRGAVGELVIGGPIVGRGYLRKPEETNAAFIRDPVWSVVGAGGQSSGTSSEHHHRFYKSGDLVRVVKGSSNKVTLEYLGRKDMQVKLQGQRIELAELEYQAERALDGGAMAIADVVQTEKNSVSAGKLLMFLHVNSSTSCKNASLFLPISPAIRLVTTAVREHLLRTLPRFMVPYAIIPLGFVPLSPSGKANRKLLRSKACTLDRKYIEDCKGDQDPVVKRLPATDEERLVCQIFADTLALDARSITMDDGFFSLGGDSVSAMQVLASLRKRDILIGMADFLDSNTPALVLGAVSQSKSSDHQRELLRALGDDDTGIVELGPIQRLFFHFNPNPQTMRFNQSMFLRVPEHIGHSKWYEALREVAMVHPMLRVQVQHDHHRRDGHTTSQVHVQPTPSRSLEVQQHYCSGVKEILAIAEQSQARINLVSGPVISLDIFTAKDGTSHALFIAHHLVVDLVSWRIILRDLESFLRTGIIEPCPLSFEKWVRGQKEYLKRHHHSGPRSTLPYNVYPPNLCYWNIHSETNTFGRMKSLSFKLKQGVSAAIIKQANKAYNTRPQEIMLAALLHSFAATFPDRSLPAVYIESHGREALLPEIDLSRTVGWFTTIWPLVVDASGSLPELVRRVKDRYRSVPHNGLAYFASESNDFTDYGAMEVIFNYEGAFQQLETHDALFRQPAWSPDQRMDVDPATPRFAAFDVEVVIIHGALRVTMYYPEHARYQARIQQWAKRYETFLIEAAEVLPTLEPNQPTLSDFPLAALNYNSLAHIQRLASMWFGDDKGLGAVENIYPCSDAHTGLIQGQTLRASNGHKLCLIFELKGVKNGLSPQNVARAWRQLVRRHSILRSTVVALQRSESLRYLWVTLRELEQSIPVQQQVSDTTGDCLNDIISTLKSLGSSSTTTATGFPANHSFAVLSTRDGRIFCKIQAEQCVLDATSVSILLHDLALILQGNIQLDVPGPHYSQYVSYLQDQPRDGLVRYWKPAMARARPCVLDCMRTADSNGPTEREQPQKLRVLQQRFDDLDTIHEFCSRHGLTLTNVFQVAWGLVLRAHTGSDSVCFGTLVSGRDIPLLHSLETVGPFFNLVPCLFDFKRSTSSSSPPSSSSSLMDALRENQAEMAQRVKYQHFSLADVLPRSTTGSDPAVTSGQQQQQQHGPFFNTCLSVQSAFSEPVLPRRRTASDSRSRNRTVTIETILDDDPSDYDIFVAVALSSRGYEINMRFWDSFCTEEQAAAMLDFFTASVRRLISVSGA